MTAVELHARCEPPDDFICPISCQVMRDPVTLCSGHTFERSAIAQWLSVNASCPLTRAPVQFTQLRPNVDLKHAIDEWLRRNQLLQVTEDPSIPHCTLDLTCSNIPSLAQGLATARTTASLVDILQKLQVLAWQSDGGKHAIARQPGMIPRLLRLLHSDACVVSWHTAELLGFLSLRDTLLRTILHTASTAHKDHRNATTTHIDTHIATLLNASLPLSHRTNAAWRVWLASLDHAQQRPRLLQPALLTALHPMLNPGAPLSSKLAAARVLRSVALATAPEALHGNPCFQPLAAVLQQLLTLTRDDSQAPVARAAAMSAVANLAAAGGRPLCGVVLDHDGLQAAQALMLHGGLPGQRWAARLLAALAPHAGNTASPRREATLLQPHAVYGVSAEAANAQHSVADMAACASCPAAMLLTCCRAAVHVLRQADEQCQEFGCHALRALVMHSDAARQWLLEHWGDTTPVEHVPHEAMDGQLEVAQEVGRGQGHGSPVKKAARLGLDTRRQSLDESLVLTASAMMRRPSTQRRRISLDVPSTPRRQPPPPTSRGSLGVLPMMYAQSPTVRLHACRVLGALLHDAAAAQCLLRHASQEPPTLRALCCQLADPVERVQVEAALVLRRGCHLLAGEGGVALQGPMGLRGALRLLASPNGEHQQLAASLLVELAQHTVNHPAMCRVGVVHALVDLLGGGEAASPVGVTAVAALRALAATTDKSTQRHVEGAVRACAGLSMDTL